MLYKLDHLGLIHYVGVIDDIIGYWGRTQSSALSPPIGWGRSVLRRWRGELKYQPSYLALVFQATSPILKLSTGPPITRRLISIPRILIGGP